MRKHVIGLACMIVSVFFTHAPATAMRVSVTNEGPYPASVTLYVTKLEVNIPPWQNQPLNETPAPIKPGESYTFETGGWCPSGLTGAFHVPREIPPGSNLGIGVDLVEIAAASLAGVEISPGSHDQFTAWCWDASRGICRKRGTGDVKSRDYGFCAR